MFKTTKAVPASPHACVNHDFVIRAKEKAYNDMIAASRAKLAETTLVPGYTKIYA